MDVLEREAFDSLFAALARRGYRTVGPTLRDGAIIYDELASSEDLPQGWTDRQAPGSYRLERRSDRALFGYSVGPHSWKKYLFPAILRLFRAERDPKKKGLKFTADEHPLAPLAFLGARACELAALEVQDRVFAGPGSYADSHYSAQRKQSLVIAVQCTQAGGTCFCGSWGTGPKVRSGFDVVLTEVIDSGRHFFLIEAGSDVGRELLAELPVRAAADEEVASGQEAVARVQRQMGRELETEGLRELLNRSYESPQWEEIGKRCLACSNCTLVCPTCFCSTVEETTTLTATLPAVPAIAERHRRWDSCFTLEFSYLHGGSIRSSIGTRYRQWMTHKLATWIDQFGTAGCVGCGRCLTWCPVGIDITAEARALRESESAARAARLEIGEQSPKRRSP